MSSIFASREQDTSSCLDGVAHNLPSACCHSRCIKHAAVCCTCPTELCLKSRERGIITWHDSQHVRLVSSRVRAQSVSSRANRHSLHATKHANIRNNTNPGSFFFASQACPAVRPRRTCSNATSSDIPGQPGLQTSEVCETQN